MTGFAGWVGGKHTYEEMKRQLKLMASSVTTRDAQCVYLPVGAMAAPNHYPVHILQNGTAAIVVVGDVYWHHKRMPNHYKLSLEEILEAYLHQGPQCLNTFQGEYSLAIVLAEHGEVFLASDHFSTYPIYYAKEQEHFVFANSLKAINKHMAIKSELSQQSIYEYVNLHFIASPHTIYKNIHRVQPGHYILHRKNTSISVPYWQPTSFPKKQSSFTQCKKMLLSHLNQAIIKHKESRPGAFLSGGLDSSTVAGIMSEQFDYQVNAFTIGFKNDKYDESAYAKLVAKHFNLKHYHRILTSEDVSKALPDIFAKMEQPFGNASLLGAYFAAQTAKEHGVDVLLAGDGGDELFGGNSRYKTHYWYNRYKEIPKMLRWLCLEGPMLPFSDQSTLPLIRKAKKFIVLSKSPIIGREHSTSLLNDLDSKNVFCRSFVEQIELNQPLQDLQNSFNEAQAKTWLGKLLCHDFKWILAENDIQKVRMASAMQDIQVYFPLLDDPLVRFAMKLPDHLKVGKRGLRPFYKKALRGWLPKALMNKPKHGFGVPIGQWILENKALNDFTNESFLQLKQREIIKPNFVDHLLHTLLPAHPGYYGVMAWDFLVLENWLQKHCKIQANFDSQKIVEKIIEIC